MSIEVITQGLARSFAQLNVPGLPRVNSGEGLTNILNLVYMVGGIAAVIVIIVAGYFYVTSNGNQENVKRAKNAIVYASVGLIAIIMAFSITWFVSSQVGKTEQQANRGTIVSSKQIG